MKQIFNWFYSHNFLMSTLLLIYYLILENAKLEKYYIINKDIFLVINVLKGAILWLTHIKNLKMVQFNARNALQNMQRNVTQIKLFQINTSGENQIQQIIFSLAICQVVMNQLTIQQMDAQKVISVLYATLVIIRVYTGELAMLKMGNIVMNAVKQQIFTSLWRYLFYFIHFTYHQVCIHRSKLTY
ncbi:transmembrane protein, putative (macronuclear) [Tetrahymena thermophila SB210]|uniref:Transmembrane protein, putative n=1 Tax=Tetrahymena thermophila (strain SB210) TaxID=312017 RepID=Q233V1_TETTS|nr:transmembrane protein, putative [Tetrahymena thermophila SB210]EAR91833.2 transmembrane protein, putative [Tetrahymena thermophila SB210]|eukprot:XP_001012078.2 transmembrane protein, putative [Tetrahymena thermophila SB210]